MEEAAPVDVAVSFLERFSNGEFDAADELIHSERSLDGAADFALLSSLLFTDFLATFILGVIPTEVTEATVIEEGPTTASIETTLDVAGVWSIDAQLNYGRGTSTDSVSVMGDVLAGRSGPWISRGDATTVYSAGARSAFGLDAVDDGTPTEDH